jgi:hypothetical protein
MTGYRPGGTGTVRGEAGIDAPAALLLLVVVEDTVLAVVAANERHANRGRGQNAMAALAAACCWPGRCLARSEDERRRDLERRNIVGLYKVRAHTAPRTDMQSISALRARSFSALLDWNLGSLASTSFRVTASGDGDPSEGAVLFWRRSARGERTCPSRHVRSPFKWGTFLTLLR